MKRAKILNLIFAIIIVILLIFVFQLKVDVKSKEDAIDKCLYSWADYIDSTKIIIEKYEDSIKILNSTLDN